MIQRREYVAFPGHSVPLVRGWIYLIAILAYMYLFQLPWYVDYAVLGHFFMCMVYHLCRLPAKVELFVRRIDRIAIIIAMFAVIMHSFRSLDALWYRNMFMLLSIISFVSILCEHSILLDIGIVLLNTIFLIGSLATGMSYIPQVVFIVSLFCFIADRNVNMSMNNALVGWHDLGHLFSILSIGLALILH